MSKITVKFAHAYECKHSHRYNEVEAWKDGEKLDKPVLRSIYISKQFERNYKLTVTLDFD